MKNYISFFTLIYKKRIIRFFLIPVFLFVFWLFASVALVYYPPSFSVVARYEERSNIKNFTEKKLLKGQRIEGFVKASENNFAILVIRFKPSEPVPYKDEDRILFRLKEKGKGQLISENGYNSGIINEFNFLPIGFPKIKDSKDKTYEFEIISLKGNERNAVSLSSVDPLMESQYKFSREEIFANRTSLVRFITVKLNNFLSDRDSIFLSFPYLVPLAIYLLLLFVRTHPPAIFFLVSVVVAGDALINYRTVYYAGEIILIFAWIFCIFKYKLDNSASFFFSVFFIILSIYAIIFHQELVLQKSSEWAYYLLAIGIAQTVFEIKTGRSRLVSLKALLINTRKGNNAK